MTRAGDTPESRFEAHDASAGRRTSGLVRFQDRSARILITSGGIAVVLAMLGICVFLVVSAAPLFVGGEVKGQTATFGLDGRAPAWITINPAFGRFITLDDDGVFRARSLDTGELLATSPALQNASVPGLIRSEAGTGWVTLTLDDGSFVLSRPEFGWEPAAEDAETDAGSYSERMDDGSVRLWTLGVERLGPFDEIPEASAVDVRGMSKRSHRIAAVTPDGLRTGTIRKRGGLGIGGARYSVGLDSESHEIDQDAVAFATGSGDWALVIENGRRIRAIALGSYADERNGGPAAELGGKATAAAMALGSETLLIGDGTGLLTGWTPAGIAAGTGPTFSRSFGDSSIVSVRPGDRDRTIAVGTADGTAVLYNTLSDKVIARISPGEEAAVSGEPTLKLAAASPASDVALLTDAGGSASVFEIEPGHTGSSFKALFGKVKYEGYDTPEYVYQSTGLGGTEPKFSLVPLIFGTIKATVVAMLFAVPLGVLAAIYSSEFLGHGVRKYFKPTIELMASLPSVVLGFMAAMVVAPFVRDHLPAVLVVGATGPLAVVLTAHAWRMIPRDRRMAMGAAVQFGVIVFAAGLGVLLAVAGGGVVERVLFSPDDGGPASIRGWLNGDFGSAMPGWVVVLLLPVTGVLLLTDSTVLSPFWRRLSGHTSGLASNVWEFIRLMANLTAAFGATLALASLLQAAGFDPRDSVFGQFSQRNTLVVGLIMGIAVIPIIYTISEDAIRSVPDSLRSASLGVGATPWQTAVRVVLPVAGSGVFSACMIGLGRAVGETMIVLMATGNTPEMSWNIFSGFRTLAANIAVELPEAPRGGTHYRVLFLCGLVLFAMTLVINTTAEIVRQHFRKRNASL